MSNQGKDTNTVLTNLSKYVTVVSSEPYSRRKLERYGLPSLRSLQDQNVKGYNYYRGSRPLHQTTMTFETLPVNSNYLSTMKESFSGRYGMVPCKQIKRYPSLHTSQFKVGINSQHDLTTTSKQSFTDHSKHPFLARVDRTRWLKQMAGRDMMDSTRYKGSDKIDFASTYSKNHHQFLSLDLNRSQCPFNGKWKTSIYNFVDGS